MATEKSSILVYYKQRQQEHWSRTYIPVSIVEFRGCSKEDVHSRMREKMLKRMKHIPEEYSFEYMTWEITQLSDLPGDEDNEEYTEDKLSTLEPIIPKWEYLTIYSGNPEGLDSSALDSYGIMGWELITTHKTLGNSRFIYTFKRQKS